jgi:hypothetical protein
MPDSGLTPPMFSMKPPFEDVRDAKILVKTSRGDAIGNLVAYHHPKKGKFGIRIDILHPPVYLPTSAPVPENKWVDIGYIPVTSLKLSQKQIQNIRQIDHEKYSYTLKT